MRWSDQRKSDRGRPWRWLPAGSGLLVLIALGAGLALPAASKTNEPKVFHPKLPRELDNLPPMRFLAGELQLGPRSSWRIGDTEVLFERGSRFMRADDPSAPATPRDGGTVLLMGQRLGDSFIVRFGLLQSSSLFEGGMKEPIREVLMKRPADGSGDVPPQ
jgi:hypothetical protein